ncbi:xylulokinase [Oceanobacillus locisalsi]|uniref:Xylulokinase n=1 Tax=Oceanobacillus locisalsi TaxID=546107 RepID=A0ABW3NC05_9BACI
MTKTEINADQTALGIELGSTRIKAVLIGADYQTIASGEFEWENSFENGLWTYHVEDVWNGLQTAYQKLANEVKVKYRTTLTKVGSIGISAMMHGYLPFDSKGNQLVPFRTWRNTNTEQAAVKLTSLFQFNIPLRWSIAHLYQAILDSEEHIKHLDFLTTLSGYIHWKLTGQKILGIGEASGMFPIDFETGNFNLSMIEQLENLITSFNYEWSLRKVLPTVQKAGTQAGNLTEEGANLLDITGNLKAGIPLCPPEGDAGTGMVATNSVRKSTGNVSAGTSIFAMIVLEKGLSDYYPEIDMVTTPDGKPVAMVHCNNFTSDVNAWMKLFSEIYDILGTKADTEQLFTALFQKAMEADADTGGLVNCSYYSGEPITGLDEGRPLLVRSPDSKLTLSNLMQSLIYSALATLRIGMEILTTKEKVQINYILGHGGFFKTEKVGQQMMANALETPISVMENAGEGGPWGMAVLAAYSVQKKNQSLIDYLHQEVFVTEKIKTINPTAAGIKSFEDYLNRFHSMLEVERVAVDQLK